MCLMVYIYYNFNFFYKERVRIKNLVKFLGFKDYIFGVFKKIFFIGKERKLKLKRNKRNRIKMF